MVLVNLASGVQRTYPYVVNYAFSKAVTHLAFTSSIEQAAKPSEGKQVAKNEGVDPRRADGVYLIHLDSIRVTTVAEGLGDYKALQFSEDGAQLSFLGNRDDYAAKNPGWSVFLAATRGGTSKRVAAEGDNGVQIGRAHV